MMEEPASTDSLESERSTPSGDTYDLSGDFRGATINIKSTIVGAAEVKDIEDLPPEPGEAPFQGLQYFDEKDADRFFGREALTARIVGRLNGSRFLAVIGASGSGKSSLVRAGVIPALRRGERLMDGSLPPTDSGQWAIHTIIPTAHPLEALAASLMRDSESISGITTLQDDLATDSRALALTVRKLSAQASYRRLLLVVDQFEEVFTACRSEPERKAFIDNLVAAVDPDDDHPITVLITLRADFYAQCAQYDGLRELLSQRQEYIGAMSRDELFRAIVQPVALGNWKIQEGLVDLMLDDVGQEPGALPLLSHALLETWKRRRGRTMTLSGYTEAGGVRGAIAQTAETVFQQRLAPEQRPIARMVFVRLAELGEGSQDTRRRAAFSELLTRATDEMVIEAVLRILTDARLVTTDTLQPSGTKVVQVAHEALIREWPTLQEWLDQDRETLIRQRQLTEDANEWVKLGRDPGALYRGERLRQTLAWATPYAERLSLLEAEFLEASQVVERQEVERAKKLLRAQRLQRVFVVALLGLLIVAGLVFLNRGRIFAPTAAPQPTVVPALMDGEFNIAVAEFGLLGEDGVVSSASSDEGKLLSQWVYEDLTATFSADVARCGSQELDILVWHDSPQLLAEKNNPIGVVADAANLDSAAVGGVGDASTPADAAERINADVIVYGVITRGTPSSELQLRLHFAPQEGVNLAHITQGIYQLQAPILYGPGLPGLGVQETLGPLSRALAWIGLGLNFDVLNESANALCAFLEAQTILETLVQAQGYTADLAITQFLIGMTYLARADEEADSRSAYLNEAQRAFERSLENSDGRNARAKIGLGSVHTNRAQDLLRGGAPAADVLKEIGLSQGFYGGVFKSEDDANLYGVPVYAIAQLGAGLSSVLEGQLYLRDGAYDAAQAPLRAAIETLTNALSQLQSAPEYRLVAQTYQGLGSAYLAGAIAAQALGETDAEALHRSAVENYEKCVQQAQISGDRYLADVIAQGSCTGYPSYEEIVDMVNGGS